MGLLQDVTSLPGLVNRNLIQPVIQQGRNAATVVNAGRQGLQGLGQIGVAAATHNQLAEQNAIRSTTNAVNTSLSRSGGLYTPQMAQSGNIMKGLIKPALSAGANYAPFFVGPELAGVGRGGSLLKGLVKSSLLSGGVNAGSTAAVEGVQGKFNPTDILKSGALGAGMGLAGGAFAGLKGVTHEDLSNAAQAVQQANQELGQRGSVSLPGKEPSVGKLFQEHYKPNNPSPAEQQAAAHIVSNPDKFTHDYNQSTMKEFGVNQPNIVSTDEAKFVIPKFNSQNSVHYQKPASAFSKAKYQQLLANSTTKDKPVLIMSGGTGAGKTTAIKNLEDLNQHSAVVDTNSNDLIATETRIKQALDSGRKVQVTHVYRDPVDSFQNGVISRGQSTGRLVPVSGHVDTHLGSRDVIKQLAQKYSNHPDVTVKAIDNSGPKGNPQEVPIYNLPKIRYNRSELQSKLKGIADEHLQQGKISPEDHQTYVQGLEQSAYSKNGGQSQAKPRTGSQDQVASRFANTTAQASPNLTDPLKAALKDKAVQYTPQTEKAGVESAVKYAGSKSLLKVSQDTLNTLHQKAGTISRQDALNAHEVAMRLQEKGGQANLETAAQILGLTSEHYTAGGQLVQAAATLANQTPQGLYYSAIKTLSNKLKGGVPPELNQKISGIVDQIKQTQAGTPERSVLTQNLVHTVNQALPRGRGEAGIGIWRAGLLSGPETVAKVGASYGISGPVEFASRVPSALIDRTIAKSGLGKIINRNNPSYTPGERTITASPSDLIPAATGAFKGAKAIGTKLRTGVDVQDTGGFSQKMGQEGHQTPYEQAVMRVHGSTFKPAYTAMHDLSIKSEARTVAMNQGFKGDALKTQISDLIKNPTEQMKTTATHDAERAGNMEDTALNKAAQSIQKWNYGGVPFGKFIVPFSRIPSAIATKGIVDYTPVGVARGAINLVYKGIVKGSVDQRAVATQLGRGITGSLAGAVVGAKLMQSGRMTLSAPADPKEASVWKLEGKQPNSIKIGNTWVTLNAFGPIGITLGFGGAYQRGLTSSNGDHLAASSQAIASAGKLVADQPYVKGLSGLGNALSNPAQDASKYIDQTTGSIIPALFSQTARGSDPLQRASTGSSIVQNLESKVPGLRENLPAAHDPYGNLIPGSGGTLAKDAIGTINPFYPSQAKTPDAATTEVQRLYDLQGRQGPDVSNPTTIQGNPVKQYSGQQVQDFIASSGPVIHNALNNLIQNSNYQSLSDAQKTQTINSAITAARQATKVATPATYLASGPSKQSLLTSVVNYAKAFMTSPAQAFNDIFHGQTIIGTAGGGLLVQRATKASTDAVINNRGGGKQNGTAMQLDHVIPLELGGTNKVSNLSLITQSQDSANNKAENFLGTQLKSGKVNMKTAQQLIQDYKNGNLSGQDLFTRAGGSGKNPIPDTQKQVGVNNSPVASKGTKLSQQTQTNPNSLGTGTIKIGKTGKASLTTGSQTNASETKLQKDQQALKAGVDANGNKLNPVQLSKLSGAVSKEVVTSKFDPQITQLYSMSKTKIADYLSTDPNANQDLTQLKSLDSQLLDSGVISKSKFANGLSTTKATTAKSAATKANTVRTKEFSALGKSIKSVKIKSPKGLAFKVAKPRAVKFTAKSPKPPAIKGIRLKKG